MQIGYSELIGFKYVHFTDVHWKSINSLGKWINTTDKTAGKFTWPEFTT